MTESLPEVQRAEVDGVPVLWIDVPEPFRGGVAFRVGSADETLPEAGITHLVEHLALSTLTDARYEHNGFVDFSRTVFYASGSEADVLGFIHGVGAALQDLPLDRLELEKRILTTEAAGRKFGPADAALAMRFGPRGPGRTAYEEFGLRHLDNQRVSAWCRKYFCRENAVIWLSGTPPGDLKVELVSGDSRRGRALELPAAEPNLPCWINYESRWLGATMLGPRSAAFHTAVGGLRRQLIEALRHDAALSYSADVRYVPVGVDAAYAEAWVDCLPDHKGEAAARFVAVLESAGRDGMPADHLREVADDIQKNATVPGALLAQLDAAVVNELFAAPILTRAQLVSERAELNPAATARALADALDSAMLVVPPGTNIPGERFRPSQQWSTMSVQGVIVRSIDGAPFPELVVGQDGVSLRVAPGKLSTVRFEDCAAMLRWNDGARTIFGNDGFRISFQPEKWKRAATVHQALDDGVHSDRWVPMGDRQVPAASPVSPPRRGGSIPISGYTWLFAFLAVAALAYGLDQSFTGQPGGGGYQFFIAFVFGARAAYSFTRHRPRGAGMPTWYDAAVVVMGVLAVIGLLTAALTAGNGDLNAAVGAGILGSAAAVGAAGLLRSRERFRR